jgi:hypothetical protein
MRALRLALAAGIVAGMIGIAPAAQANDCSNPKDPCGGCELNRNWSLEDPIPVRCYPT